MIKKLVGDKSFYKRVFALTLPIMIQNGITNFVNMLDNIMIGATGTAEMTGVSISNQLFFVFNLCIFGAVSGAGIFSAQFFGKKDYEGVHNSFRFKMLFCTVLTVMGIGIFAFFGEPILSLYMQGEQGLTDVTATMGFAKDYMSVMLIGLLPFAIVQAYSSTLREGEQATLPMIAGAVSVVVNLVFNYILIFGKFGAPALGVKGAAIATVFSRFVEFFIIVIVTHANTEKYDFMKGVYKSFKIPAKLAGRLFIKSLPLMLNETMWASGLAVISQCYSIYGLDSIAAVNISQTFWNVFSIAFLAVGTAIGIILGQMLGANEIEKAMAESYKMIACSLVVAVVFGLIYIVCAEFIPMAYNTENEIRQLATTLMQITAFAMPFEALTHATYFTLRSGGKMMITIIFDCGFTWGVNVLLAVILSRFTPISFVGLFALIQFVAVVKGLVGLLMVKNGFWAKNIISKT
ncbi:MAG: MATE family efflux transporter [Clostridia bacterium]|nr:MATE family efflux transporter [Clostridia bacterium]